MAAFLNSKPDQIWLKKKGTTTMDPSVGQMGQPSLKKYRIQNSQNVLIIKCLYKKMHSLHNILLSNDDNTGHKKICLRALFYMHWMT